MLSLFNKYFLNVVTPILLLSAGMLLSIRLRLFYVFHPVRSIKLLLKKERRGDTSPFSALCLALAGTLGVGNIVGVASAIIIGGYGSVFWMWVSALLAMSLKYAEIVISMKYRERLPDGYRGGAAYYIRAAFSSLKLGRIASVLSTAFAVFCVLNSLTMGCMLQSNAISSSFSESFGIPPWVVGIITSVLFIFAILYKSGRVEKITGIIVPVMSLLFIVVSVIAILMRRERLPAAFSAIFKNALDPRCIGGGALGFLTSRAFRAGSMRGLVSNEAGAGTAPTAHAMSDTKIHEKQGLMGVIEVFADTIILCTLTALVIILSGTDPCYSDPMALILNSYSDILGEGANTFICISIFLFAFATLICWAKYGASSLLYITESKAVRIIYMIIFSALITVGTLFTSNIIWDTADFSIGIMTLINLLSLFILQREITKPNFKNTPTK